MEEKHEVKTVRIQYRCPKCGNGFLIPTGTILTTYPPMIPHQCDTIGCDYGETFNESYPKIILVNVEPKFVNETFKIIGRNPETKRQEKKRIYTCRDDFEKYKDDLIKRYNYYYDVEIYKQINDNKWGLIDIILKGF